MRGREGNQAEDGGRGGRQEMIKFRNVLMDLRWGDIEESKISTESGPSHWNDRVTINCPGNTAFGGMGGAGRTGFGRVFCDGRLTSRWGDT